MANLKRKVSIKFSDANRVWTPVDITLPGVDPRWKFFERSNRELDGETKSNRSLARCTLCQSSQEGRLERMAAHILGNCQKVSVEQQTAYRIATEKRKDEGDDEEKVGEVLPRSVTKTNSFFITKRKFTFPEQIAYADALTSALVTSNVPARFVENEYFQKTQQLIAQTAGVSFKPLKIYDVKNAENRLWNTLVQEEYAKVDSDITKTLCMDNWRDGSNISHEAIIFDKVGEEEHTKFFFDTLDSERTRKTSRNLYDMLTTSLDKLSETAWDRISAMCTDSPSSMVKLRSIVQENNPHIIVMGCVLHVLSLLTKDCIKFEHFSVIMRKNMEVVQFFKRSEIWSEILSYYEESQLIVFIKTRWYYAVRVIHAILKKQTAFEQCVDESMYNIQRQKCEIPQNIQDIISDPDFYWINNLMLNVVKPIADCVGNLEGRDAHIGLVLHEIIILYRRIHKIQERYLKLRLLATKRTMVEDAVALALDSLNKRAFNLFENDIYIIAFFLTPEFRSIATSKFFPIASIVKKIFDMIRKMNHINFKSDANWRTKIYEQLQFYSENLSPFIYHAGTDTRDVHGYWKLIEDTNQARELSMFALRVFALVFHSAPVETLFSTMGNMKTLKRNRMQKGTLKKKAQLYLALKSRESRNKTKKVFKPRHGDEDDNETFPNESDINVDESVVQDTVNDHRDQLDDSESDDDHLLEEYDAAYLKEEEPLEVIREWNENNSNEDISIADYFDINQPLYQKYTTSLLSRSQFVVDDDDLDDDAFINNKLSNVANLKVVNLNTNEAFESYTSSSSSSSTPSNKQSAVNIPVLKLPTKIPAKVAKLSKPRRQLQQNMKKFISPPKSDIVDLDMVVDESQNEGGIIADSVVFIDIHSQTNVVMETQCTQQTNISNIQLGGVSQLESECEILTPLRNPVFDYGDDFTLSSSMPLDADFPLKISTTPHHSDDASEISAIVSVEINKAEMARVAISDVGSMDVDNLVDWFTEVVDLMDTDKSCWPYFAKNFYKVGDSLNQNLLYRWGVQEGLSPGYERTKETCFAPYFPKQQNGEVSCIFNCFTAVINQPLLLSNHAYYYNRIPHPWKHSNLLFSLLTSFTEQGVVNSDWKNELQLWSDPSFKSSSAQAIIGDAPPASKRQKSSTTYIDNILSPIKPSLILKKEHIQLFCQNLDPTYLSSIYAPEMITEGLDTLWYLAPNDLQAHYLFSSINDTDVSKPLLYLGVTKVGNNECKSATEIDKKVMKGNVVICNSSPVKDELDNLVMHANVMWKHDDDKWSYYEPLSSDNLDNTLFNVTFKECFHKLNRTTATYHRHFYHFQIDDQEEFSHMAIVNLNKRIDLALKLLKLHDGSFGMTIPPGMMFQYDRRTIVPNWSICFGGNHDNPSNAVPPGSKLFLKLYEMRWKRPQDYDTNSMSLLFELGNVAAPVVAQLLSGVSSKSVQDAAIKKLDDNGIAGTKYTGGVPYTLHDIYRSVTIAEELTDNHINAHFSLLRYYLSYRVSLSSNRRLYSLFMTSFFIDFLIGREKGFAVINKDCIHRMFQQAIAAVMGSFHTEATTIADMEMILVPVNINGNHWCLVVAFMKERVIRYWDPLINNERLGRYDVSDARRICSALLAAIVEECRLTETVLQGDWKFIIMTNAPRQGSNECGDYVCLYADLLCDHLPVQSCCLPKSSWLKGCDISTLAKGNSGPSKSFKSLTPGFVYRLKMINDVNSQLEPSYCDEAEEIEELETAQS